MSGEGMALVRAAEALLGCRFRLHGRDPATGLDCVGLVVAALKAIGRPVRPPTGYGLRNRRIDAALVPPAGLVETSGNIQPGDIVLAAPGPLQHHLLIAGRDGCRFIHAHAGLRRVVETPGPIPWPLLHHWRLSPIN
ncbi:MAG: peptidoglycan endopeptidase [Oxalobacteraceae bacterium]|nr:MAG: peptidoglycan endopeptidase [Oxalobacteraceae bacterium]